MRSHAAHQQSDHQLSRLSTQLKAKEGEGMTLLSWLGGAPEPAVCKGEFPALWSAFVDHIAEQGFAGHATASPEQAGVHEPTPTVLPAAERLVAIGDIHGDLGKARRVFRAAGLTDDKDRWIGGSTVCVQVGDILDRGDAELRILYFLESLQAQAKAAGGALHVLNGNHETMNVMGNHRYATMGSNVEIERWNQWQRLAATLKAQCDCTSTTTTPSGVLSWFSSRPAAASASEAPSTTTGPLSRHFVRTSALQPGSNITKRFFANHPTVLQVGSTVFVHGGILEHHVQYGLDNINRETREWMRAEPSGSGASTSSPSGTPSGSQRPSTHSPPPAPMFLRGADAVVWSRSYSTEDSGRCDCEQLQRVLAAMPGAERMVMGHTIQGDGVNSACVGRAWRVDVGMSKGCGNGEVEALEILQDGQKVMRIREGLPSEDVTYPRRPLSQDTHRQPTPTPSWWQRISTPTQPQPVPA